MYQVIIVIHVLLGLGVIGLILMQQGKGADAGAAFGTGSSGSVFGAQGAASFLSRATAIFATLFFTTSLGLAVLNSQKGVANDLIGLTEIQQKEAVTPNVTEPKIAEDIPAQAEIKDGQVPVSPSVPVTIPPAANEGQLKENMTGTVQPSVVPDENKKEAVDNAPKAADKPKVVKKMKHDDSKATKKSGAN